MQYVRSRSISLTSGSERESPFTDDGNLSPSDMKRFFFVWFNSISPDNISISKSQFYLIMNSVFSTTILSKTKTSEIFNELLSSYGDNNKQRIYYNQFLSQNEDRFTDIITELLQNDSSILATLELVPNISKNNANSNTLQQILCDQCNEILMLRKWIISTGLPSISLHNELSIVKQNKNRMSTQLKLVEEETNDLKSKQDIISESYTALKDDYTLSIKQTENLKSINGEYVGYIDELKSSLDTTTHALSLQRQVSRHSNDTVHQLKKFIAKYKKTNAELRIKNDQQSTQITSLSQQKNVIEMQLDHATTELAQKTDEIHKLQQQLLLPNTSINSECTGHDSQSLKQLRRINRTYTNSVMEPIAMAVGYNDGSTVYPSSVSPFSRDSRSKLSFGFNNYNPFHFSRMSSVKDMDSDFKTLESEKSDTGTVRIHNCKSPKKSYSRLNELKQEHFSLMLELKKQLEDISNTSKTDPDGDDCEELVKKKRKRNKNEESCDLFGVCLG